MIIDVNIRGSWVKEYTWEIPVLFWQFFCKSKSISECYLCSWYSWCLFCLNSGNTIHRLLPRSVIATGWFDNSGGAPKPWPQTSCCFLPAKWKDNDQRRLPKAWGRRDDGSHECQLPCFSARARSLLIMSVSESLGSQVRAYGRDPCAASGSQKGRVWSPRPPPHLISWRICTVGRGLETVSQTRRFWSF